MRGGFEHRIAAGMTGLGAQARRHVTRHLRPVFDRATQRAGCRERIEKAGSEPMPRAPNRRSAGGFKACKQPVPIDCETWIGRVALERPDHGIANACHVGGREIAAGVGGREARSLQQAVALGARHLERIGKAQDNAARGIGAAGFEKGDVARGDVGRRGPAASGSCHAPAPVAQPLTESCRHAILHRDAEQTSRDRTVFHLRAR